jgi:hypothetical protein
VLTFINFVSVGNLESAVNFAENLDKYINCQRRFFIPSKNLQGKEVKIEVKDILMLLCFLKPEKSELKFLVSLA